MGCGEGEDERVEDAEERSPEDEVCLDGGEDGKDVDPGKGEEE